MVVFVFSVPQLAVNAAPPSRRLFCRCSGRLQAGDFALAVLCASAVNAVAFSDFSPRFLCALCVKSFDFAPTRRKSQKVREYPPHDSETHCPRAKNFSISHARLVSGPPARPALASQPRPLSHLGRRSNAAANPHRRGDAILRAFLGAIPERAITGARTRTGGPETLVRPGLLQPRPQSASRGKNYRHAAQWTIPARTQRRARAPRHRHLHRRRPEHCLRCSASRTRWQRGASLSTHKSDSWRPARSEKLARSHRRRARFPCTRSSRRLEPSANGTRRSNLHAAIAALRSMSSRTPLPSLRGRPNRRNPRATPQTRLGPHENRRRYSPRSRRPHTAGPGPRRARYRTLLPHVAIPRRRSHAESESGITSASKQNAFPREDFTRGTTRGPPRRDLPQYHPAAISSQGPRSTETAAHQNPAAETSQQPPHLQRHPQNRRRCRPPHDTIDTPQSVTQTTPPPPLLSCKRPWLPPRASALRPSRRCNDISKCRCSCWSRRAFSPSSAPASSTFSPRSFP